MTSNRKQPIVRFPILLLLITLLYFSPVLITGKTLLPVDMIYSFPFFQSAAPIGFDHPGNPLLSDAVLKFYPWSTVVQNTISSGQFPLWNPYIFTGTPMMANAESGVFFPLNWIRIIFPDVRSFTYVIILKVFLAGVGMYLFCKSLQISEIGSRLSGLAFAFGSSMTVWLNFPVSSSYLFFPWLFFAGENYVTRHKTQYLILLAFVIAAQLFGGHYQTVFIGIIGFWIFLLYRLGFRLWNKAETTNATVRSAFLLALATVLGVGIAAVQIVPFYEWLNQTAEVSLRLEAGSRSIKEVLLSTLLTIGLLFFPGINGNPTDGTTLSYFYSNFIEVSVYIGIIPLALTALSLAAVGLKKSGQNIENRSIILFWSLLAIFSFLVAQQFPVIDLFNRLPVSNLVVPARYRLLFTFCLTILAGYGMDTLLKLSPESTEMKWMKRALLGFAGLGVLFLGFVSLALMVLREPLIAYNRIRMSYPLMVNSFSPFNLQTIFPIMAAILLWAFMALHQRGIIKAAFLKFGLLTLVLVDLFIFGFGFNPSIDLNQVFPETRATRLLRSEMPGPETGRILAIDDNLPPNTASSYGFADVAGSDFPPKQYTELIKAAGGELYNHNRVVFHHLDSRLINLLNVRFVISAEKPAGAAPGQLQEVYQDKAIRIYENKEVYPRAFQVHSARVMDQRSEVLSVLQDKDFDPRSEIVLEEDLPAQSLLSTADSSSDEVVITAYLSEKVTLETNSSSDSLLFMSDAYYPGWEALIDGSKTHIYRADYAFRAVYLPKGVHKVEFRYRPVSLWIGAVITMISLLTLGIIAAVIEINKRKT